MADDAATHGCIGLPKEFAELLFGQVRVGDQVVIWSGKAA
jgi:lipoprotein-anchoring transpeptidase ErfK/SrfK